jgi:hypothetical protein
MVPPDDPTLNPKPWAPTRGGGAGALTQAEVLGVMVNKVPPSDRSLLASQLRRKFEGSGLIFAGAIPEDALLDAVSWGWGWGLGFSACVKPARVGCCRSGGQGGEGLLVQGPQTSRAGLWCSGLVARTRVSAGFGLCGYRRS